MDTAMIKTKECVQKVLVVVLIVLIYHEYTIFQLRCNHKSVFELQESLKQVASEIENVRKNHSRLILVISEKYPRLYNDSTLRLRSLIGLRLEEQGPTQEYEIVRRRINSNSKEFWYYMNDRFRSLFNESFKSEQIQTILEEVADRKRSLLSDQERLPALDGHEEWRCREAASVSDLLQRRLHYLQNPPDCRTAKKLLCLQNYGGVGCNTHHVTYCLLAAYGLQRTVVLVRSNMTSHKTWENIFQPLSETCTNVYLDKVNCISEKSINETVTYLPLGIVRFNGDPYSWWLGQLLKYNMNLRRPDVINATIAKMNLKWPLVGVHIRRTDKIIETPYNELEEYMSHVADYYAQLELTRQIDQRRVYITTDDVNVLKEAVAKYPQYKFYGDYSRTKSASLRLRHTSLGYTGILVDLHVLSMCDYIVCTFSSNIGRMSYELMQTKRIDAVNRYKSLDSIFYFTGVEKRTRIAVMRNKDIAFEVGELIKYDSVNGTSSGTVLKTNTSGRIPWYKTEEIINEWPYPEYTQVPLYPDPSVPQ